MFPQTIPEFIIQVSLLPGRHGSFIWIVSVLTAFFPSLSLLLDVLCKQWVNVSQRLLSEWGGRSGFHSMGLICIIMYGDAHFFPMQRIQTFFKHESFSMDFSLRLSRRQ